jgi:hypothetical protein
LSTLDPEGPMRLKSSFIETQYQQKKADRSNSAQS